MSGSSISLGATGALAVGIIDIPTDTECFSGVPHDADLFLDLDDSLEKPREDDAGALVQAEAGVEQEYERKQSSEKGQNEAGDLRSGRGSEGAGESACHLLRRLSRLLPD